MKTNAWIETYLSSQKVPFSPLHHRATVRSRELADLQHLQEGQVAKVVVSIADEGPALLVLAADRYVRINKAQRSLHRHHLRLAREDEIAETFPDCQTGAIPPFNHWENIPIYVDEEGFSKDLLMIRAGRRDESVLVNYNDWKELVEPIPARFSEKDSSTHHLRSLLKKLSKVILFLILTALAVAVLYSSTIATGVFGAIGNQDLWLIGLTGVYSAFLFFITGGAILLGLLAGIFALIMPLLGLGAMIRS